MDTKKILKLIDDLSISDDDVFRALVEYTRDRKDATGKNIPPTPEDRRDIEIVKEKIQQQRAAVWDRFYNYVVDMASHCCGPKSC